MILRFKKGKEGKPSAFACVRADGSATYQRMTLPAEHDLGHYAVETTMGWREAFLGLVAAGRDLDSFGTKNGVKDIYTHEERWAEEIVGLLQWPALSGGELPSDEALLETHRQNCAERNLPAPPLTPDLLQIMREKWRALPPPVGRPAPRRDAGTAFPAVTRRRAGPC